MSRLSNEGYGWLGGRRRLMVGVAVGVAVVGGLFALTAQEARAGRSDLRAAIAEYPHIDGTQLDACSLCHVGETNYRLDDYGRDFERARGSFEDIEPDDSDGDGFDNITEINALTFPGKADSFPTGETPEPSATPTPTETMAPTETMTPEPTATEPPEATDTPGATAVPEHVIYLPFGLRGTH